MRKGTALAMVLLALTLLIGGSVVLGQQKSLSDAVTSYHELNNDNAQGAPQQTVVGTWSTREAVQSLGVVIAETGVFLALCVCLSAAVIVWRLDSLRPALTPSTASETAAAPASVSSVGGPTDDTSSPVV